MNITKVSVNLTGNDILSIINDFVRVDGLNLEKIKIENGVYIEGSFKKGIKIKFEGLINSFDVIDGKIHCRFASLKVYKLGIFRIFRSLGLKIVTKFVGDLGIDATKDRLIIDVDKILKGISFIKLKMESIYVNGDKLCANVENINISLDKIGEHEENEEEVCVEEVSKEEFESMNEEENKEETDLIIENKVDDYYTKGRDVTKKKLEEKVPPNVKEYSDYLFVVPDLAALIFRLLKDERVPMKTKVAVSASIAYIACPSDLIPNKIPFIGKIDDLAILFFALNRIAKDVELNVIVENWSGKNDLLMVLRSGLEYVTNFTGAKNIEKIFTVVEELKSL